jgi:hypothetical protein
MGEEKGKFSRIFSLVQTGSNYSLSGLRIPMLRELGKQGEHRELGELGIGNLRIGKGVSNQLAAVECFYRDRTSSISYPYHFAEDLLLIKKGHGKSNYHDPFLVL